MSMALAKAMATNTVMAKATAMAMDLALSMAIVIATNNDEKIDVKFKSNLKHIWCTILHIFL